MDKTKLRELYDKYELEPADFFKSKHFTIITRAGIEKIQAKENLRITYKVERCEPEFCAMKAITEKDGIYIETFGSAKYGDFKNGNTSSWYLLEMAEKRSLSRCVLKYSGFYKYGIFSEDESEDFKRNG